MLKTLAIIGARLNSSRLPGKHLLPLPADATGNSKPMIGHLLARLRTCKKLGSIELATTADDYNAPLVNWAYENHVPCLPFEGDVNDLMGRLDVIIQRHQPDYILYICGDCPLIDPEFIDHALTQLQASMSDTICLHPGVNSLHEGMGFYSKNGWDKLMSVSQCAMSREHVGYGDKLTQVLDTLAIDDSADYSLVKHRISVDTQADYRFMAEIYQRWYSTHAVDSVVSLQWVQQLLLEEPALRQINMHVQQKRPDKDYAKISLYCHLSSAIGLGHLKRCVLIAQALQEQLGTGTEIFVIGERRELPWLSTNVHWLEHDLQLFARLKSDTNSLVILDFHPNFIDEAALIDSCKQVKQRGAAIVAMDKMSSLLPCADLLFVPSFFTRLDDAKVSFGWDHYLFDGISQEPKEDLVLFLSGGSDALGFGQSLPAELHRILRPEWRYVWVQGPLAPTPELAGIEQIELMFNPPKLAKLIAKAKIIVTCYGLSLFESMASGAAVILLPVQHLCEADELAGLAETQSCLISHTPEEAAQLLATLQSSPIQIDTLSMKAGSLFAGSNGMSILIQAIKKLLPTSQHS